MDKDAQELLSRMNDGRVLSFEETLEVARCFGGAGFTLEELFNAAYPDGGGAARLKRLEETGAFLNRALRRVKVQAAGGRRFVVVGVSLEKDQKS